MKRHRRQTLGETDRKEIESKNYSDEMVDKEHLSLTVPS